MVSLAVYGLLGVAGVGGGVLAARLLTSMLGEAAPNTSVLDRVAEVLAALFASLVLPADATAEDCDRIFKNAVATAALGVAILVVVAFGTDGPLAVVVLVGAGLLIGLGTVQALVAYGEQNYSARRTR